ncbi:MAG: NDP-sugar synthase [Candidatus Thermoplasmatota archaeon]|nr:NDP-sugar synthase [Candidatus Thermoplasmatota archaeon]
MEAVLLAGGFGTRLLPLTKTRPKVMVPLLNRPMIEHVIESLPDFVDTLIFAVGYQWEKIREHYKDYEGKECIFRVENKPLGTGGAVKNCENSITGTFFVLNPDVISSVDPRALADFHGKKGGVGTLSLWKVEDPEPYGIADLCDDGSIKGFVEKPRREEAPSMLANAGTYLLEREVLDLIPHDIFVSIERETFPLLVQKGFYGLPFTGYFLDAGNLVSYIQTQKKMLELRDRTYLVGQGASVYGLLGENVCIGQGTVIGAHSSISSSAIFQNTKVEEGANIYGSIVGDGCLIGRNVQILDSIIGDNAVIDDGVSLNGARLEPEEIIGAR